NALPPTQISTLSLHDALPISIFVCEAAMATSSARGKTDAMNEDLANAILSQIREDELVAMCSDVVNIPSATGEELEMGRYMRRRSEEHTSELQSLAYLVCRLL